MIASEALLDTFINANILFCLAFLLWRVVREIMRTVIDGLAKDFSATPTEVFRYSC